MPNVYEMIAKKYDEMSRSQQKIAKYILENKAEVSFMNVSALAKAIGVSEATIIRFATFMNYCGYPQMQKDLQAQTQKQLSMKERLYISYDAYKDQNSGIIKIFMDEIGRLRDTMESLEAENFFNVIEVIKKARRIAVVAGRSAMSLGYFMQYYLDMMMGNVVLIGNSDNSEAKICDFTKDDLVIGLTFYRYTKSTCDLIHFAHENGIPTICITDRMTSPVIRDSTYYFLAETSMPTYLDSFVAPLTIINAILTYVGKAKSDIIDGRIGKLEKIWKCNGTFYKEE